MITLAKTGKPLHTMTDSEVHAGVNDWNTIVNYRANWADANTDNYARGMRQAYTGELVRRATIR